MLLYTKETIISPSLIKEFDPSRPIPLELLIGWEELMGVPINPAHYNGLCTLELGDVKSSNHDKFDLIMNRNKSRSTLSSTLLAEVLASEYEYINLGLDSLLLQASQQLESTNVENNSKSEKENNYPTNTRFGQPQRESNIKFINENHVPKNTVKNMNWAQQIWQQWATVANGK